MIPSLYEPADLGEIHTPLSVKADPFRFQQLTLLNATVPVSPRTDFAPMIDDPMPGDIGVTGESSHRITDDAGRTFPHNFCDLAVGDDLTGRNLTDNGIYSLVQGRFF